MIPITIKHWKLQSISKYVRAAAEFVNLHSKWRGINRFPALTRTFEVLRDWPEPLRRGVKIPDVSSLQAWIDSSPVLSDAALEVEIARTGDPVLKQALKWSQAIDWTIADMVRGVPPFPWFRECAERLAGKADVVCISVTTVDALEREWREHDIAKYAALLAGHEMGSKEEILRTAAGTGYRKDCTLMMGDAPGDLAAARANGALFFPINPDHEEESWERFYREGFDRFLNHTYAGGYERTLIADFEKLLPEQPPWKRA